MLLTISFLLVVNTLSRLVLSLSICDRVLVVVDVVGCLRTLVGPLDILVGWDIRPVTLLLPLPLIAMESGRSYFAHDLERGRYAGQ